mmetsp:Transcript_1821/g.4387  ORF Transcript_1821/g.4387 Transcript_1821/m.4387 type:complete len:92 (-) Transcript_1821:1130-1405(-)
MTNHEFCLTTDAMCLVFTASLQQVILTTGCGLFGFGASHLLAVGLFGPISFTTPHPMTNHETSQKYRFSQSKAPTPFSIGSETRARAHGEK